MLQVVKENIPVASLSFPEEGQIILRKDASTKLHFIWAYQKKQTFFQLWQNEKLIYEDKVVQQANISVKDLIPGPYHWQLLDEHKTLLWEKKFNVIPEKQIDLLKILNDDSKNHQSVWFN